MKAEGSSLGKQVRDPCKLLPCASRLRSERVLSSAPTLGSIKTLQRSNICVQNLATKHQESSLRRYFCPTWLIVTPPCISLVVTSTSALVTHLQLLGRVIRAEPKFLEGKA